jgi:tetratricopeptide (TPR) repeat protein
MFNKIIVIFLLITSFKAIADESLTREQIVEKYNDGNAYFNLYNYEKALENYAYCNKVFVECANNTGVAYLKLGDNENAAEWFTLAASNGFQMSINTLKKMGRPIPANIKSANQNNNTLGDIVTGSLNVLNAIIGGYNRGADSALRNRPRNASCTTIGNTTDCYEY